VRLGRFLPSAYLIILCANKKTRQEAGFFIGWEKLQY